MKISRDFLHKNSDGEILVVHAELSEMSMKLIDHVSTKRAGRTHRKLSMKMKRKLRREKRKARLAGYQVAHFYDRPRNPSVDKEAESRGMSRAQYVEWKSRQPPRPPKRREPVMVFVRRKDEQPSDAWMLLADEFEDHSVSP